MKERFWGSCGAGRGGDTNCVAVAIGLDVSVGVEVGRRQHQRRASGDKRI